MTASTPPPPSFPPSSSTPSVPEGWKAEWSTQHKTWYYFNLSSQATQWDKPTDLTPPPVPTLSILSSPTAYQPWNISLPDRSIGDEKSSSGGTYYPQLASGPPPPPPPCMLYIHKAVFHDQDVTAAVRDLVAHGQILSLNTDNLTSYFGDPAYGTLKQLSIVHSYDRAAWEVAATFENHGNLIISPKIPLETARFQFIQSKAGNPNRKIIAVVWGSGNALLSANGRSKELKLKEIEVEGRFEVTSKWMGFDPNYGVPKLAVAYYRLPEGDGIGYTMAVEGSTCRLPWNALVGDFE